MNNPENIIPLYAELRATVIGLVHETMNSEITSLRTLVRAILIDEIEAHKADIARAVLKEINDQVRLHSASRR